MHGLRNAPDRAVHSRHCKNMSVVERDVGVRLEQKNPVRDQS